MAAVWYVGSPLLYCQWVRHLAGGISACADGGAVVTGDVRWFDNTCRWCLKLNPVTTHFLTHRPNGCADNFIVRGAQGRDGNCRFFSIWCRKMTVYPNLLTAIVTVDPGNKPEHSAVYNVLGEVVAIRSLYRWWEGVQPDLVRSAIRSVLYHDTTRGWKTIFKASFIIHR